MQFRCSLLISVALLLLQLAPVTAAEEAELPPNLRRNESAGPPFQAPQRGPFPIQMKCELNEDGTISFDGRRAALAWTTRSCGRFPFERIARKQIERCERSANIQQMIFVNRNVTFVGTDVNLDEICLGKWVAGWTPHVVRPGEADPSARGQTGMVRAPPAEFAIIDERCIVSWDGEHHLHSVDTEVSLNRTAVVTTMKKLRHCVKLKTIGPVSIKDIAGKVVEHCRDYALNHQRTRHAIELIVAVGADIVGTKGGATTTKLSTYAAEVASTFIDCLQNDQEITPAIRREVRRNVEASVERESEWIYWKL